MTCSKSRCILFLTLALFLFATLAQATQGINKEEALQTAQQWANAVGAADVPVLRKLLDDQYVHIHGTARVESKEQFLEAFTSGARRYDPIALEEVSVRTFGDTALVNGKFKLKAFVRDKILEGVNRFTLVIVKENDMIRVVSFHATAIPQK